MSEYAAYVPVVAVPQPARETIRTSPVELGQIIQRIEDALDTETAAIRTDMAFDLKGSNARKSRHLYELTRAVRTLGGHVPAVHRESLLGLRAKLERNEAAILAHMSAVGEVAGMIQEAIRRTDADGTYSAHSFNAAGA